ncbi:hypothetical protein GF407_11965 [candidate division KSB1 bacterium]|nr:hypothetical protein [candidate division KSB1 bacterium]
MSKKDYLKGASTILSLYPRKSVSYIPKRTPFFSDKHAIADDWHKVGKDISTAFSFHRNDHEQKS